MNKTTGLFFLTVLFLSGCLSSRPIRTAIEPARCQLSPDTVWCRGIASWYGKEFHGRKTSNGETYDMYGLSAAHRTLPLGTLIEIVSVENRKSVVVKVNDRGPFIAGRILDLSYGAASALDMVQKGTAEVNFRVIQTPTILPDDRVYFTVQAGAFSVKENAMLYQYKLQNRFNQPVRVIPSETPAGTVYRVRIGQFRSESEAEKSAALIAKEMSVTPFVLRQDPSP